MSKRLAGKVSSRKEFSTKTRPGWILGSPSFCWGVVLDSEHLVSARSFLLFCPQSLQTAWDYPSLTEARGSPRITSLARIMGHCKHPLMSQAWVFGCCFQRICFCVSIQQRWGNSVFSSVLWPGSDSAWSGSCRAWLDCWPASLIGYSYRFTAGHSQFGCSAGQSRRPGTCEF